MSRNGYLLSIALTVAGAMSTATVMAAEEAKDKDAVEEVIITAQKVEQNQQTVPIATSVFTEEQLRVNRMEAMVDVAQRTPGMVANEVNPAEPNLAIRGIGSEGIDSNAAGDPSSVTFLDGVYIGRGGGANLDLLDLERVEVLRGPQGTLFGKNVVGGLVNLVTRRPSQENFADRRDHVRQLQPDGDPRPFQPARCRIRCPLPAASSAASTTATRRTRRPATTSMTKTSSARACHCSSPRAIRSTSYSAATRRSRSRPGNRATTSVIRHSWAASTASASIRIRAWSTQSSTANSIATSPEFRWR